MNTLERAFYINKAENYIYSMWDQDCGDVAETVGTIAEIAEFVCSPCSELSEDDAYDIISEAVYNLEDNTSIFSSEKTFRNDKGCISYILCEEFNFVHLKSIFVEESKRGQGNGSQLLVDFLATLSESTTVTLDVSSHGGLTNAQLYDWYRRKGFTKRLANLAENRPLLVKEAKLMKKQSELYDDLDWTKTYKQLQEETGLTLYRLKQMKPSKYKLPSKYDFTGVDLTQSHDAIAKQVGCSLKTVQKYLARIGKREVQPAKRYAWNNYDFTGKTASQVAKETGCKIATAMYQMKKRGIYKSGKRKSANKKTK